MDCPLKGEITVPVSEAQKKASAKYLDKLDEVRIRMPKGRKAEIKDYADAVGESLNAYINGAIDLRIAQEFPNILKENNQQ